MLSINVGHDNGVISGRNGHFALIAWVKCFLLNPNFDLEPDYIVRKPWNRFQLYIVHRVTTENGNIANFPVFTHEVEYTLNEQYVILPIQTNRGANAE